MKTKKNSNELHKSLYRASDYVSLTKVIDSEKLETFIEKIMSEDKSLLMALKGNEVSFMEQATRRATFLSDKVILGEITKCQLVTHKMEIVNQKPEMTNLQPISFSVVTLVIVRNKKGMSGYKATLIAVPNLDILMNEVFPGYDLFDIITKCSFDKGVFNISGRYEKDFALKIALAPYVNAALKQVKVKPTNHFHLINVNGHNLIHPY